MNDKSDFSSGWEAGRKSTLREIKQLMLKHLGDYYFDMHILDLDEINIEHYLEKAADELEQKAYTLSLIQGLVNPPPYTEGELYELTQVSEESEDTNG